MVEDTVLVKRHIRSLRGSSNPFLAEASDGHLYIVKPMLDQKNSNQHFNESAGTELYRALGLNVPSWRPLLVTETFIARMAKGAYRNGYPPGLRAGVAFGSRFLGEGGDQLFEVLPGTSLSWIENRTCLWSAWLIDICALHTDNRQAIFTRSADRRLNVTFIDHGQMFGGSHGDSTPPFIASRYLDSRIYPYVSNQDISALLSDVLSANLDLIWQRVSLIPEEWKTSSGIAAFGDCLGRLSDAKLLESVVNTILHALERETKDERTVCLPNSGSNAQVLCPFIHGT